ncbi:hypothetical protein F5878DRAFT_697092 [Lentinula raphanica]|uniref:EF-hand domain-containing protein n=1 Tax=Lentinula raphanica TaxID=153919 RepID=A0AA38PGW9_9AGAR|nr:hypothetical protein F5878DRAFT_697092 [Lentinula raphanica]
MPRDNSKDSGSLPKGQRSQYSDNYGGSRKNSGRPRLGETAEQARARRERAQQQLSITPAADAATAAPVLQAAPRQSAGIDTTPAGFFSHRNTNQPILLKAYSAASNNGNGFISADELLRLNQQINFIEANDPDHEIASGDQVIDDSIFDSTDSDDAAQDECGVDCAEVAEAETRAAEPTAQSFHTQMLQRVLEGIKADLNLGRKPRPYRDGDFWIRPKHPAFALEEAATTGYTPTPLYERAVFLWLPDLLTSAGLRCTCGNMSSLVRNVDIEVGFNDDPIARRIRQKPMDYFLLTARYRCNKKRQNNPGCGLSWQGTDPHIIGQLSRHWQEAFPAFLSNRGGIDKSLMAELRSTSANRFGATPYAELVSELQRRHHSTLELSYLACAQSHGFQKSQVPPFSPFDNPLQFAGAVPSPQYMKAMFTDWFAAYRIYMERDLASTSGLRLSGDHTFWIVKHMGGFKGVPMNTAVYSCVNEFEEVRGQALCLTKSLSFVRGMYDGIAKGLQAHGHGPTRIIYCDQPQVERDFHESVTPSLAENVHHVTRYSDLEPFMLPSGSNPIYCDDSIYMQEIFAIAIKYDQQTSEQPKLDVIQLRTAQGVFIFKVSSFRSPSNIVPSLRALLTSRSILKIGLRIYSILLHISLALGIPELEKILASSNPQTLDLGKHAKLKGVVSDTNTPLDALSGTLLNRFCESPEAKLELPWSAPVSADRRNALALEIECIWAISEALFRRDSIGLPLDENQSRTPGQLVTLVTSQKPVAEGVLLAHNGFLDTAVNGDGEIKRINVTSSRSLIEITKVLLPLQVHRLHGQTIQWIYDHGKKAVVTTSMLRSRSETSPLPSSSLGPGFTHPVNMPVPSSSDLSESALDSLHPDPAVQNPSESIDPDPDADGQREELAEEYLEDNHITDSEVILEQSDDPNEVVSTHCHDDAYHFMDRLTRLLSAKHSAYKDFAFRFSQAIFVRDATDEAAVRAVIERKGGSYEYMKRAHSSALNRRIRRLIPNRHVLYARVKVLFDSFRNVKCSTKAGKGAPFFSDAANEMANRLLETIRLGFLSDPPGISLYYLMGRDRDGLNLYRCIRGTNSIEGGLHMLLRRMFGALSASAELTEALLINWLVRRNKTVGYHNRTGQKYKNHFDIWVLDEIVEISSELDVKTSFAPPPMLTTCVATSETFGIIPIALQLAEAHGITTLPPINIEGVPHHRDLPVHALTRLSTRPTNPYLYVQLRQRSFAAILPVHTAAEYRKAKAEANNKRYRRPYALLPGHKCPAHEAWKDIDFDKLALDWNADVEGQDPGIKDPNKRIYYKLPQQLEQHYKKTLQWSISRATMFDEVNAESLRAALDMLDGPNRARVLPPVTFEDLATNGLPAVDVGSFNPMAILQENQLSDATSSIAILEPLSIDAPGEPLQGSQSNGGSRVMQMDVDTPSIATTQQRASEPLHQSILTSTTIQTAGTSQQMALSIPSLPVVVSRSRSDGKRCGVCAWYYCPRRFDCSGNGGRAYCKCAHDISVVPKKVRITEVEIQKRLTLGYKTHGHRLE